MNSSSKITTKKFYRYDWNGTHDICAPFNTPFSTFQWRGQDSWINFGCFIINNKDDLKWLGFSTKNNYSAPIYGSNTQSLISTTFDGVKLSLNLGLYGITTEDYRKFFNWMDPLIVDHLYLNFDKNYYYVSKVANISEATKYVIGYQNNKQLYYAEVKVTFELQGEICGWNNHIINWEFHDEISGISNCWVRQGLDKNGFLPTASWISDLRNSIKIYFNNINGLEIKQINVIIFPISLWLNKNNQTWEYKNYYKDNAQTLCNIVFNDDNSNFSFVYDSADGVIYQQNDRKILSNIDVQNFNINKFLLPDRLNDFNFYTEEQTQWNNKTGRLIRDVGIQIEYITQKTLEGESKIKYPNTPEEIVITSQLKTPVI